MRSFEYFSFPFILLSSVALSTAPSNLFAQEPWSKALEQDSTLYCQIKDHVLSFKCGETQTDLTKTFQKNYSDLSGNSDWWLFEDPCSDGMSVCVSLLKVSNEELICKLDYEIPAESYNRKDLSRWPAQGSTIDCMESLKEDFQRTGQWVRDYPLFIKSIEVGKNKKDLEWEKLWWVRRWLSNPNQGKSDALIDEMRKYHFVFIPGITYKTQSDSVPNPHFDALEQWMAQNGIWNQDLNVFFNEPPEKNKRFLLDFFSRFNADEKFIVITLSKGGMDLAEFLLDHKELWAHEDSPIKGWIPINTPFWGTTLAKKVLAGWMTPLRNWQEWKNGLSQEFTEMLSPERAFQTWCQEDGQARPDVEALLSSESLKILSVRSWTDRASFFHDRDARGIQKLMKPIISLYEEDPSDGYIWFPSMQIPCVDFVSLEGFHHWDLTKFGNKVFEESLDAPRLNYDAIPFFQALIYTLLKQEGN